MFVWRFGGGGRGVQGIVSRTCRVFEIEERKKLLAIFALLGGFELL